MSDTPSFKFSALSCIRATEPTLPVKLASLQPTLLAYLDDVPYHDKVATVTANYSTTPAQWNPIANRDTQEDWDKRTRQAFDANGMDELFTIPENRLLIGDHNMGSNNWTWDVASANKDSSLNVAYMEEVVAIGREAFAHYQNVTSGDFVINPHDPDASKHVNLFNNPPNTDSVTCEWNDWVLDRDAFFGANDEYSDYPENSPSELIPTDNPPTLFWREGWKFDGTKDNDNPDIEMFFCQGIAYREYGKEGDGSLYGVAQKEWLKQKVVDSVATYKIIMQDKVVWDWSGTDTGNQDIGNSDGQYLYWKERDEVVLHFDNNDVTGLLWVGGDAHRPHIDNIPPELNISDTHPFTEITNLKYGSNSICTSPFGTGYNGTRDIDFNVRPQTMYVRNGLDSLGQTPLSFVFFEADQYRLRVDLYDDTQDAPVFSAKLLPNVNYLVEATKMTTDIRFSGFSLGNAVKQIANSASSTNPNAEGGNYFELKDDDQTVVGIEAVGCANGSRIPFLVLDPAVHPIDAPFPFESVTVAYYDNTASGTVLGSSFAFSGGKWFAADSVSAWDVLLDQTFVMSVTIKMPSIISPDNGGSTRRGISRQIVFS